MRKKKANFKNPLRSSAMFYRKLALSTVLSFGALACSYPAYAAAVDVSVPNGQTLETGTEDDGNGGWGNATLTPVNNIAYYRIFSSNYHSSLNHPTALKDEWKIVTYDNVTIGEGATWRPMDWVKDETRRDIGYRSHLIVKNLNTDIDSVVDLAWLNNGDDPKVTIIDNSLYGIYGTDMHHVISRMLVVREATLSEGTTFKINVYAIVSFGNPSAMLDRTEVRYDNVIIEKATPQSGEMTNLYIRLGWVPINESGGASGEITGGGGGYAGGSLVLAIKEGASNFNVIGQSYFADSPFSKYYITPQIEAYDNDGKGFFSTAGSSGPWFEDSKAWFLTDYRYITAGVSESGMAAGDNAVAAGLLQRTSNLNLFRGTGYLHGADFGKTTGKQLNKEIARDVKYLRDAGGGYLLEGAQKENIWAEAWHGKFKSKSGYGRSVAQNYNGLMVGYDKMLSKDFYNGKAYAGFYFGKLDANTTIETGGGKQDVKSIGVYSVWAGDRGHYLDLGLQAAKFKSELNFTDSNGSAEGRYSTWGYTLGAQYGFKNRLDKGWFVEPQAGLFYGQSNGVDYELSNHLEMSEEESKSLTGRLGIKAGKQLSEYGNVYLSAAALRDFKERAGLTMSYGSQSQRLELPSGKDTWYELGIGGNIRTASNSSLKLDFVRTLGGNLGDEWRVNALFEVTWGGDATVPKEGADYSVFNYAKQLAGGSIAPNSAAAGNAAAAQTTVEAQANGDTADAEAAGQAVDTDVPAQEQQDGGYSLPGLTVEADRPDWERNLSPGAVSVVYPEEYKGEQKTLPDLLERVPGLFIQRVNGLGHYTVARVRASTAAQVHVYVDGVLMNLNGNAAVNLSNIPVENVERVEVYRGYVPARFSYSPLGGVINIVTKKPGKPGWYISEGFRSYGGYRGSYEYTTPFGKGSLLLGYNRDVWRGDFPFGVQLSNISGGGSTTIDREGNDYRNSDALVKWQDENWMVKFSWKKNFENLPYSMGGYYSYQGLANYGSGAWNKWLEDQQTEFQVGRRDTVGSLDWGWRLNYLDLKKRYRYPWSMRNPPSPAIIGWMPGDQWSDYDSKKFGGNLNAAMKMGNNHLVEFNFDYSHETMDADGSGWDIWNSTQYAQTTKRIYIHGYKIKEYHLSLQDSFKLNSSGDFILTPMLKADKVDMSTMSQNDQRWMYSGGIGLRKDFGKAWTLKSTWGTYNRHPNFYEIFGDGGNIKANYALAVRWGLAGPGTWETGTQFDFSVNWRGKAAGAKADITLTWFQRDSKDLLVLSVPPMEGATAAYLALDGAKAHGLELGANLNWKRVNLNLNATWQKSRYNGVNYYLQHKPPLTYTPEWVMSARLDYTLPGDKLNLFAEYYYVAEQDIYYQGFVTRHYLDAVGTVNLGLKYSFGKGFKLSLGVNDVFDKCPEQRYRYRQPSGITERFPMYPLPGRMYYATMEYKF